MDFKVVLILCAIFKGFEATGKKFSGYLSFSQRVQIPYFYTQWFTNVEHANSVIFTAWDNIIYRFKQPVLAKLHNLNY